MSGELYRAGDPELEAERAAAREWMVDFNAGFRRAH